MKKILCIIAILFLPLLPCTLSATTWYTSQDGVGTKDGSSVDNAHPWSGIFSHTQAGDTLEIIGCVQNMSIGTSGTSAGYFNIKGYDSSSCIQLGIVYDSTDVGWSVIDEFGAYSIAYTLDGKGAAEFTTANGIVSGYTILTNAGKVPDGDWVAGNYYTDTENNIFYWKPYTTNTGKSVIIEAQQDIDFNEKTWVKLSDIKIYGGSILILDAVSTNVWIDNIFLDNFDAGYAVMLGANDFRLSNSTITNGVEGLWNFAGTEDNIRIDHNIFTNFTGGNDSHCIGIYKGGTNWVIENNDLSYANTGITVYNMEDLSPLTGIVIRYNYIHNTEGARSAGGGGFNRGYGIGFEGSITTVAFRTDNYIHNNLVTDCSGSNAFGISLHFPKGANNYVYNNTVNNCSPNYYISYTPGSPGGTLKNNISYNYATGTYHILVNANADQSGLDFDYNLYYPDDAAAFHLGSNSYTFANWKTAIAAASIAGADAHSLSSDPLFVSATDFSLQSGSPARNAGVSVGLTQDIIGRYIDATIEIGAYEYGTTSVGTLGSGCVGTIGSGAVATIN
jgi:hypothetical protein